MRRTQVFCDGCGVDMGLEPDTNLVQHFLTKSETMTISIRVFPVQQSQEFCGNCQVEAVAAWAADLEEALLHRHENGGI